MHLTDFATARFSPTEFDSDHVASSGMVDALLDAARLAPSAGNSQPWAFIVGRRGDGIHQRLVPHLARSSAAWASDASVLVANLSHRLVEESGLTYSEFSGYDLGQAVAHLTFQAHALGMAVHQFRGFDREAVTAEFGVPSHWEVTSMAAVGVAAQGFGESATSRERRTLADVTWARE